MARVKPIKVGLIGSGAISGIYLKNMTQTFSITEVVGCSDLIPERAQKRAEEFGIRAMTNEEILSDPEIEIVVNTTYPLSHYPVIRDALLAGKHVYCEKMMAADMTEARELMKIAKEKNLRLSIAPDTFLGASAQTARKLIDDGYIGEPLFIQGSVVRGYRPTWEMNAGLAFVFTYAGGIPFDMGGYYLHAMLNALGGISRVSGFGKVRQPVEIYENPRSEHYRETYKPETPNMLTMSMEFANGCLGSLTTISEGFGETPHLVLYGTLGTLKFSDPNNFGDALYLSRMDRNGRNSEFYEVPLTHGYAADSRGISVADMAWAIRNNRPHRGDASMGLHAMEAVCGALNSCETGQVYTMTSQFSRPAPLPQGYTNGTAAEACFDQ